MNSPPRRIMPVPVGLRPRQVHPPAQLGVAPCEILADPSWFGADTEDDLQILVSRTGNLGRIDQLPPRVVVDRIDETEFLRQPVGQAVGTPGVHVDPHRASA
jgi:hypothetical protein